MRILILITLFSLAWQPALAGPIDRQQLLSEASDFFQQASQGSDPAQGAELYRKALIRFEKLVNDGVVNGKLYYNLANTHFQLHDLGRAIVNYRRALALLPDDDNLRQNLRFAESQQVDRIAAKQETVLAKTLLFWHYDLSAHLRLLLLVVANAVFWILLALKLWRRQGPWWPLALALTVCLMMGGSLMAERLRQQAVGVLIAEETTARKGDGQAYGPSFDTPLHAGLVFSLVERRQAWLYIELADGRRCWVPAENVELI